MITTAQALAVNLKAKLFRGFADPSRLAILEALRGGPLTVTEITAATHLSQSNVSNHLASLRDSGLIIGEQEGRFTRYRHSDQRVGTLLDMANELFADLVNGVYEYTRNPRSDEDTSGA